MKRSEVNEIMRAADDFIRSFGFILPPFAYWTPDEMKARHTPGIVEARLGWDITDYGQGDFAGKGLFLFTVRNGSEEDLRRGGGMCYAEKIMISRRDQISPMHRHIVKAEDIINRGGATLALKLHNSDADGNLTTHIRTLQQAGYVSVAKSFQNNRPLTTCSLTTAGRKAFADYIGLLEQIIQQTKQP